MNIRREFRVALLVLALTYLYKWWSIGYIYVYNLVLKTDAAYGNIEALFSTVHSLSPSLGGIFSVRFVA